MRPLSVAVSVMLALACEPRATVSEPARKAEAVRPPATNAVRPAEAASDDEPASSDVRSGLDEAEAVAPASSVPSAQPSKLSACCRALRDMATQAPAPQHDLVLRVAEHCERLATQADVTAAKRELRGQLVSIDPPAVCH
jgi:hypothetical protein